MSLIEITHSELLFTNFFNNATDKCSLLTLLNILLNFFRNEFVYM